MRLYIYIYIYIYFSFWQVTEFKLCLHSAGTNGKGENGFKNVTVGFQAELYGVNINSCPW